MELNELKSILEKDEAVINLHNHAISNKILKNIWVNYQGKRWFPYIVKDRNNHLEGFDFNESGEWGKNQAVGRTKISLAEMLARLILKSYKSKAAVRCKTDLKGNGNGRNFSEIKYDGNIESILNKYKSYQNSNLSNIENTSSFSADKFEMGLPVATDDNPEEGYSYQADPEKRRCIELFAEDFAVKHYQLQGYSVEKKGKPYDLLCIKNEITIHVEVKGTTGLADKVILTRNEVIDARAKNWQSDLFIVYGIKLNQVEETWQASEGIVNLIENWEPKDGDLQAINYEYTIPKVK